MQIPIKTYPAKPDKVYLYGTCLANSFGPESGVDALTLLENQGIEVVYPKDQTCCGQPAFNAGYNDEARDVAYSQIALFPEPYPIVVLSGSCGGMMRKHYQELAPQDEKVAEFSKRIFEFSEFLVHVLRIQLEDLGPLTSVTLHTSCAGRREMGIHEAGESLLRQLHNVELKPHRYDTECCGFGGTFALKHSDISAAMVTDKSNHIHDADVDLYVSTDWGCMLNINGNLAYNKHDLRGLHLASFLRHRTIPDED